MTTSSTSTTDKNELPAIDSMRAGEIKKELESYGISTASFLEKKELIQALTKARADGLKPKRTATKTTTSSSSSSTSSSSSKKGDESKDSRPRAERLKEEMAKLQGMKSSELKKELQERGVSTKSFFEKSEFVKALAEARVDGVQKKSSSSSSSSSDDDEEGFAEYSGSDVEVLTDDWSGPRQSSSSSSSQSPGRSSSSRPGARNPFAGGTAPDGSPFGPVGMSDMGGIADMLKNMGGMGGGSPFGGANPFGGGAGGGDAFTKAQEMMSNPKVQRIIAKAQGNPRIMKKVNECLGNPASFAKYQNDPDVAELITELRKYM